MKMAALCLLALLRIEDMIHPDVLPQLHDILTLNFNLNSQA